MGQGVGFKARLPASRSVGRKPFGTQTSGRVKTRVERQTMRTFLSIAILLGLNSCGNKTETIRSMNDSGVPIHVLIDSIENHGSVESFESLRIASLDYRPGDFLSTFLIMADKYNNALASMMVHHQILHMYNVPVISDSENGIHRLDSLNNDARKMAIRYLIKADSLGNEEASNHMLEYRKAGLIK